VAVWVISVPVKTIPDGALLEELKASAASLAVSIDSAQINGKGKTYEAWALMEIALRLKGMAGLSVEARGHDDKPVNDFRFRGGPGHIPPSSAKGEQPSHFRIWRHANWPWEMHLSLEHFGASGATHELDISVIPVVEALHYRLSNGGPFHGRRLVGLELKDYDVKTTLNKEIPRALFGLAVDLDVGVVVEKFSISVRPHTLHSRTLHAPKHWLITTAKISADSTKLLSAYGIASEASVSPSSCNVFDDIAKAITEGI
jgi:hypothetical protein